MARYLPGQSGNPNGRPRGVIDVRIAYRKMLDAHVPALIDKCVQLALNGDMAAMKLIIERTVPRIQTDAVNLSPLDKSKTAIQQLTALSEEIDEKVRSGEFSVETGTALYTMLDNRRKLLDTTEIEQRIKVLEEIKKSTVQQDHKQM